MSGTGPPTLRELAAAHLWMPFSNLADFAAAGGPRVIVRAEGCRLWDSEGREYLDGVAAFECSQVGHGRDRIARAVYDQLCQVDMVESFRYTTPPAVHLAARLARLAPGDLNRVHFTNGGAEAVEIAVKFARHHQLNRGEPHRTKVITRAGAFHGTSFGAMVADGNYKSTRTYLYEPLAPQRVITSACARTDCPHCSKRPACDLTCVDDVERTILREGPETVSAVVVDPCGTSYGLALPPTGYLPRLREICDRYGVVLILDEIVTGFGRTGAMFASELYGVQPDLMTVSKGLASGYAPIGAVLISDQIAESFAGQLPISQGQTFGGHPPSCAAALANLDVIEEEQLVERAARLAPYFAGALDAAMRRFGDAYVETRSVGLIAGIETRLSRDECTAVRDWCRDLGLVILTTHPGNVFFLCPPLVVTEPEIDQMVDILCRALAEFLDAR